MSPDGRRIATLTLTHENGTQLRTRSLDSTALEVVPGSEHSSYPFWSPDGQFLCFFAEGQLRKVDLAGGRPETLAAAAQPLGGTWHANGVILFATGNGIYRVNASGGAATKVDLVDGAGERSARGFPQLLPDGDQFLYFIGGPSEEGAVWVGSLTAPASKFLVNADSFAQYANPGYVVFARGNTLMTQRFDRKRLTAEGQAMSIGQVITSWSSSELVRGEAGFSVAGHVLVFNPIPPQSGRHVWYERNGKEAGGIANPPAGAYQNPSLSPNGRWLAWHRIDPQSGNWDIWLHDVARNAGTRLTSDPAQDSDPIWSPDGERIAFFSTRNKTYGLYTKRSDSSQAEDLVRTFEEQVLPTWSADGRYIVYSRGEISQLGQIWALPLTGDGQPLQVTPPSSFTQYGAPVSPDSRWIAYASDETGGSEIDVQPFPGGGRKIQLTHGGGFHPRWRRDGKELFYWNLASNRIVAVDLRYDAGGIAAGRPKVAVDAQVDGLTDSRTQYAITADGQRLLLRQDPTAGRDLTVEVVVNWPSALMSTSRLTPDVGRR